MLKRLMNDIVNWVFPENCAACGLRLLQHERVICLFCQNNLPQTYLHTSPTENWLSREFYGRLNLQAAVAMYLYGKGARVQRLIHQLKYNNQPEIGEFIGQRYGQILQQTPAFMQLNIEAVAMVPLHKTKQKQRGYNQCEALANAVAQQLNIPFYPNALQRNRFTETQTQKGRINRFANVQNLFYVAQPQQLENKHILLIDDVITTGATIEACGSPILNLNGTTKLSILSIACAPKSVMAH